MTIGKPRSAQVCLIALTLCAVPLHAVPTDSLLTKALAQPTANLAKDFRFQRTTTLQVTDEPSGIKVENYDPARPEGQKWKTLSDTTGGSGSGQFKLSKDQNAGKRDSNIMDYTDLKNLVTDSTVTLLSETKDVARYSIKTKPGRELKLGDIQLQFDASEKGMLGELYVRKTGLNAPYVSGVKIGLVEPLDAVVIKIKKLRFGYGFVPEEKSGAMMLRAFGLEMDMRAAIVAKIKLSVAVTNAGFEPIVRK